MLPMQKRLKYSFPESNLWQETIRELLCLYALRPCMNTRIYLGMRFIICSSIRMRELKYIDSFTTLLSIWPMKDVMLE
jgi:hypothetical protein